MRTHLEKNNQHHEVIHNTCAGSKGCSGAPLCKNGEVIGIHLAADKTWREAVSVNTVLHLLREWLKKKEK